MAGGPGGGPGIAVKPGGSGDVTDSHRVWRIDRVKSAIGSGVIYDGHVYLITQEGAALCLDIKSGNTVWEERLRGLGTRGITWSSMLLADGKIYVPNQSGDVFVLRASPKFELIATNSIAEQTNASLAPSEGDVFLRTAKSLWCFSNVAVAQ
jgi:outer membrane protein assembly factor BamB